jgi:hypothetical protein
MSNVHFRPAQPVPRPTPAPASGPAGRPVPAPAPARASAAAPSLPAAMQSKFKSVKTNRAGEYFDTTSFYKAGMLPEPEEGRAGEVELSSKARMLAALRMGRLAGMKASPGVAATLDALLSNPKSSAALARRAGVPGCPNGGGVLGAVAMRAGRRAPPPPPSPAARVPVPRTPGILGHKAAPGAAGVVMHSSAPAPPARAAQRGLQRLSAVLAERSNQTAALLARTELGRSFQAIELMQEALQPRAAQVLLQQRLMPTWR